MYVKGKLTKTQELNVSATNISVNGSSVYITYLDSSGNLKVAVDSTSTSAIMVSATLIN
jgi:hypothetical protein